MKNRLQKIGLVIIGLLVLSSCQYMPTVSRQELEASYIKKVEAEAKLTQLADKLNKDLLDNQTKLAATKDKVINGQDVQLQAGADALYGIQQATIVPVAAPGSIEFTRVRAVEGFTAMGKPPTIKEIIEGGARLQKYLTTYQSGNKVDIDALVTEHAKIVKENGILVETTKIAKQEVEKIKTEKDQIQTKYVAETTIAQKDVIAANNAVVNKEKARAEAAEKAQAKAESIARLKKQLMLWCGIGAVLALVGAIYSPFGKSGLAIVAAVLASVTVIIPFITAAMVTIVLSVGGVVALAVGGLFLYNHNLAEKTVTNLVNAIEDTKTTAGATVATLKSNLTDWNATYVKNAAGEYVTKVDTAVEKYIESKLIENGRLVVPEAKKPAE
jgi:hypothetical protein